MHEVGGIRDGVTGSKRGHVENYATNLGKGNLHK